MMGHLVCSVADGSANFLDCPWFGEESQDEKKGGAGGCTPPGRLLVEIDP